MELSAEGAVTAFGHEMAEKKVCIKKKDETVLGS